MQLVSHESGSLIGEDGVRMTTVYFAILLAWTNSERNTAYSYEVLRTECL